MTHTHEKTERSLAEQTHRHTHTHNHEQSHTHNHEHNTKRMVLFYFLGLFAFFVAFFSGDHLLVASLFYCLTFLFSGYHVMVEGISDTITQSIEQKKFMPNIHILMTLAAIGSMIIGNFEEGALLILIFAGAHFLEEYAEGKSRREITSLLKMNPTKARKMKSDGSIEIVEVSDLVIGDKLQILNGDQIPTDGRILSGHTTVNESSINGESMPKEKMVGDEVFGSTINGEGVITIEVTKDSSDTVFSKILQLVNQSQSNLSKTASKIKKIEPIYVKIVLFAFPFVVFFGPFIFGWSWSESVYRGLVFLITSSPCALAASAVPATLSALSNLARKGVLFKGGAYLSSLAEMKSLAFDKTGTLTVGKPEVVDFGVVEDESIEKVKEVVYNMERQSNHPLADAVKRYLQDTVPMLDLTVENKIGTGLRTSIANDLYEIKKPSFFQTIPIEINKVLEDLSNAGKTVVFVAKNQKIIGWIAFMDQPNEQAKQAVHYFNEQGVNTLMITGDSRVTGEAVGRDIGVRRVVANVLPEQKSLIIQEQQVENQVVGMVGDGVNDAPALVKADIGIAMGEGTDVAIDVADVVIMKNDLEKLILAHRVSKRLNRIVWENMIFSMGVVVVLMVLNFMQIADINSGVIAHEGSTLLVILNGLRMLSSRE